MTCSYTRAFPHSPMIFFSSSDCIIFDCHTASNFIFLPSRMVCYHNKEGGLLQIYFHTKDSCFMFIFFKIYQ